MPLVATSSKALNKSLHLHCSAARRGAARRNELEEEKKVEADPECHSATHTFSPNPHPTSPATVHWQDEATTSQDLPQDAAAVLAAVRLPRAIPASRRRHIRACAGAVQDQRSAQPVWQRAPDEKSQAAHYAVLHGGALRARQGAPADG
ncbi:hypothetical protein L1887_57936 [Cichorium endivia]|nr:hypothetical protein L1887_57936 [Cichorium endivia]